jgi:deazaflavin-dependent oxidoreductase (nitroreductase family)
MDAVPSVDAVLYTVVLPAIATQNKGELPMDEKVKLALAQDQVIDITTTGRKSGEKHRIEIWFHNLDGRLFITGTPGKRSWYANLVAHPEFTFHVKRSTQADLPARATAITAEAQRREIMRGILTKLGRPEDLETWVAGSPLVEVTLL